ncbi:MAG: serine/threonine-protein kinase PknD [Simkania negevensis]|nr:serine/threonine-protein kinase PknD [Simkania negevensis]
MEKEEEKKKEEALPELIGNYRCLSLIGKGGMGEIYIAYDPLCDRNIALKKILPNLLKYPSIKKRFVSEAKIASSLTHPSIIPIYSLHLDENQIYYTMPYVEGESLKEILKKSKQQEKKGERPHPIGSSIPSLIRIFLNVLQGMDYAHSKGILHRDLKPENVMVGKYGEVLILDWGIAHKIGEAEENSPEILLNPRSDEFTKPGRVVGTVCYMAPERALLYPSSIKTDIYSLGVLFYQILSLRLPFLRPSLKEFRKKMKEERFKLPEEVAPHRDIPLQLSHIAKRCLDVDPKKRYDSIREIIQEIENYLEGRPEWMLTGKLDPKHQEDWEFQENVLLTKQMAVNQVSKKMEWVMLMISKESYSGNIKMEAQLELHPSSLGIGFLICIPEPNEREGLEDGYCLWIGSKNSPACKLFRSNVEVINLPEISLEIDQLQKITIEKFESSFRLLVNGAPIFNYDSHTPLVGGHVGLIYRDADFEMEEMQISLGSHNIMVNCLSIPDAFLTHKDYKKALSEYRRIAHSFAGRIEAREAIFRAGITLIEQGKKEGNKELFSEALSEFEKLHHTPGAPLEYLGKSLVYQTEDDVEEEVKCLELALRKFPKHPLHYLLEEHIYFRLHETAKKDRKGAHLFALLILRLLPTLLKVKETEELIEEIGESWQHLPFIQPPSPLLSEEGKRLNLIFLLSFCLSKPALLYETLQKVPLDLQDRPFLLTNALFLLFEMDYPELISYLFTHYFQDSPPLTSPFLISYLKNPHPKKLLEEFFSISKKERNPADLRFLYLLLEKELSRGEGKNLFPYFSKLETLALNKEEKEHFDSLFLHTLLLERNEEKLKKFFSKVPKEIIQNATSSYFLFYGVFLSFSKGEKEGLAHFDLATDLTSPLSSSFLPHYLKGRITLESEWIKGAFLWEKVALYRQLSLYYHVLGKRKKVVQFEEMIKKEEEEARIALNFL